MTPYNTEAEWRALGFKPLKGEVGRVVNGEVVFRQGQVISIEKPRRHPE